MIKNSLSKKPLLSLSYLLCDTKTRATRPQVHVLVLQEWDNIFEWPLMFSQDIKKGVSSWFVTDVAIIRRAIAYHKIWLDPMNDNVLE